MNDGQSQGATDGLLAQILLKQGEMSTQLAVIAETLKIIPDHENRIRKLERWVYAFPLSVIISTGSMALAAYGWLHH